MAARKVSSSSAGAMAVAVVLAMLAVAATAQDCGVNGGQVMSACLSYCQYGGSPQGCCNTLKGADVGCLCRTYWSRLQGTSYASCARDVQSKCGLRGC